jgi:hypothetical protein
MRIRGQLTTVRRAAEEDVDLLVRWHADPDVARYWDEEVFTRDEMLERLRRSDVEAFVIEEGVDPVGYLQVWADGDQGGLDMFTSRTPITRRGGSLCSSRANRRRDRRQRRSVVRDPALVTDRSPRCGRPRAGVPYPVLS